MLNERKLKIGARVMQAALTKLITTAATFMGKKLTQQNYTLMLNTVLTIYNVGLSPY